MRASTASAPESRGERTLMGIGPEFIRREIVADGVSGTLDGVPTIRMDRTPSSPIVVEQEAITPGPAPTVRIPIASPARTVQLSLAPAATAVVPRDPPAPAPGRSPRLDSVISGGFFREGERQEANGWEDSPLALDPLPDEEPPKISSFDRIPRRRGPLIVTTFLLAIALVVGLAEKGPGLATARTLLATEAGSRAVEVWNRAKAGLALRLTPERTVASSRAMATSEPSAQTTTPQRRPAATISLPAPATSTEGPLVVPSPPEATPQPVATGSRPIILPAKRAAAASLIAQRPRPAVTRQVRVVKPAPAPVTDGAAVVARTTNLRPEMQPQGDVPRHGLVWSPSQQRLVPAQATSGETVPMENTQARPTNFGDAQDRSGDDVGDKNVLPLDDEAHTTL